MSESKAPESAWPGPPSPWVQRWSHLVAPGASVLDVACGSGRHMKWFADKGHPVTGVDRSPAAIGAAVRYGKAILADIEQGPWPLMRNGKPCQFGAVIVTNYLWRPLLPLMVQCLAPGGLLVYETFACGNETVGKPSNPEFLLQAGELLSACKCLHVVAFEDGYLEGPPRFVQRIAAVQPAAHDNPGPAGPRYGL